MYSFEYTSLTICVAVVVMVESFSLESAGPKTFHKVELVLSEAYSKDLEQKPTPLLCSVLQALAIQGDLQNKIKLFSKNKQHFRVFCIFAQVCISLEKGNRM